LFKNKVSIQLQVPLQLPCYNFIRITLHRFEESAILTYVSKRRVFPFHRIKLSERDGRGVHSPGTYSPRRADPRLLATPTSCSRVAENNPNYDDFLAFAPAGTIASHCSRHCNTPVAQPIRAMTT